MYVLTAADEEQIQQKLGYDIYSGSNYARYQELKNALIRRKTLEYDANIFFETRIAPRTSGEVLAWLDQQPQTTEQERFGYISQAVRGFYAQYSAKVEESKQAINNMGVIDRLGEPTTAEGLAYQRAMLGVSDQAQIIRNLKPSDFRIWNEYYEREESAKNYWEGGLLNSRASTDFARGVIIVAGAAISGGVLYGAGSAIAAGGAVGSAAGGTAATTGAATSTGTIAGSTGLLTGGTGSTVLTGVSLGGSTVGGVAATTGVSTAVGTGAATTGGIGALLSGLSETAVGSAVTDYAATAAAGYVATQVENFVTPKNPVAGQTGNLAQTQVVSKSNLELGLIGAALLGLLFLI